jgi:hypothetical protein
VHVAYNQVYVIRILTETALTLLWECLGVGVGLGKGKPTKIQLLVYCCINDIATSIEAGASMPNEFTVNRKQRLSCDGINFLSTVENLSLQCNV